MNDSHKDLKAHITTLYNEINEYHLPELEKKLDELRFDIENQVFTVAVIGEFNSGKSTFVNALIQKNILPTGIIPTTATINMCVYSDNPSITVYEQNGVKQKLGLDKEQLEKYIAKNLQEEEKVEYLQIGIDSPLLKNDVVLIDTPGLNDIDTMRSDIAHQILPRADVIFFVVDSSKAFKQSEIQFIQENILLENSDRIIFVANHIDSFEEDEIEDIIKNLQYHIHEKFLLDAKILPLCAIEAIEGRNENDQELLELSGILEIEALFRDICLYSSRQEIQQQNYHCRFTNIVETYKSYVTSKLQLKQKDYQELQQEIELLSEVKIDEQKSQQIHQYVETHRYDIQKMVEKSIDYFYEEFIEDVEDEIDAYNGPNIAKEMDKRIARKLKKETKRWIDQYSYKIYTLLEKLQKGLTEGLSKSLNQRVNFQIPIDFFDSHPDDLVAYKKKNSINASVLSGAIVGVSGAVLLACGASVLVPVIGMAGLPFLKDKIHEKQLVKIKPKLIDHMYGALHDHKALLEGAIQQYIDDYIQAMEKSAIRAFNEACEMYEESIRQEQCQKQFIKQEDEATLMTYEQQLSKLNQLSLQYKGVLS